MTQVKRTWEMLRDIREGDVYEIELVSPYTDRWKGVRVSKCGGRIAFDKPPEIGGATDVKYDVGDPLPLNVTALSCDWRKIPKLVDFATAWAAYEAGKFVRFAGHPYWIEKRAGVECVWNTAQIRGKWEIRDENEGGDAN